METTDTSLESAAESLLTGMGGDEPLPEEEGHVEDDLEAEEVASEETDEGEAEEAASESDEPEEEETTQSDQPKLFTVKVDGKDTQVTEEELLRSYSGQAYIQKGMQEAAEARKQAAALQEALQTEQAKILSFIQEMNSKGVLPEPVRPSAAMAQTDPIGYMQANAEYQEQMAEYQAQRAKLGEFSERQSALEHERQAAYVADQHRILQERIPEFRDPKQTAELVQKISRVGAEAYGFTPEELGGVMDARHVQVLVDAMKYRELQAGKAEAKKPEPQRTVKPKGKTAQPAQLARAKQLEAAKRSGSLEDFADLLLQPK